MHLDRVTAGSVALGAIPICPESGPTRVSSLYCSHYYKFSIHSI